MSNLDATSPVQADPNSPSSRALERGAQTMRALGIEPEGLIAAMDTVDPQFAQTVIRFAFGEIVSREELDLRTRQLITVAVLTSLGGCESQLETHVPATVKAGATRLEVIHAMIQTTPYAGIPRVINALNVVKRTLPDGRAEPTRAEGPAASSEGA